MYGNSLQLIANAVDWSLEDRGAARDPFARTLQSHAAAARGSAAHDARVFELRHRARAARTDLRHAPVARENARREVPRVARSQGAGEIDASKGAPRMNRHVKALTLLLAVQLAVLAGDLVLESARSVAHRPARCCRSTARKVDGIVIVDEKGAKLKLAAHRRGLDAAGSRGLAGRRREGQPDARQADRGQSRRGRWRRAPNRQNDSKWRRTNFSARSS